METEANDVTKNFMIIDVVSILVSFPYESLDDAYMIWRRVVGLLMGINWKERERNRS
jgi:hypothetical protein